MSRNGGNMPKHYKHYKVLVSCSEVRYNMIQNTMFKVEGGGNTESPLVKKTSPPCFMVKNDSRQCALTLEALFNG